MKIVIALALEKSAPDACLVLSHLILSFNSIQLELHEDEYFLI